MPTGSSDAFDNAILRTDGEGGSPPETLALCNPFTGEVVGVLNGQMVPLSELPSDAPVDLTVDIDARMEELTHEK